MSGNCYQKPENMQGAVPFPVVEVRDLKADDPALEREGGRVGLRAVRDCVRRHAAVWDNGTRRETEKAADGCVQGDKEK